MHPAGDYGQVIAIVVLDDPVAYGTSAFAIQRLDAHEERELRLGHDPLSQTAYTQRCTIRSNTA